mmetsp:Transcript_7971/g.11375  ORF Transcript_7971/g.11375 Transcript_7971/m.11375 type:complete len:846 (+) Transcript_7971:22-2559(+)
MFLDNKPFNNSTSSTLSPQSTSSTSILTTESSTLYKSPLESQSENNKNEFENSLTLEYFLRYLDESLLRLCGGGIIINENSNYNLAFKTFEDINKNAKVINENVTIRDNVKPRRTLRERNIHDDDDQVSEINYASTKKLPLECTSNNEAIDGNSFVSALSREEIWSNILRDMTRKSISFPNGMRPRRGNSHDVVSGKAHDIEIRVVQTLFHRYRPQSREKKQQKLKGRGKKRERCNAISTTNGSEKGSNDDGASEIVPLKIVSDMGTIRNIYSASQLANLIVCDIQEHSIVQNEIGKTNLGKSLELEEKERADLKLQNVHWRDIRSDDSGVLCLITDERANMLRNAGRLPCPKCIKWFRGEKGLWWHEQIAHGVNHSDAAKNAQCEASINDMALVVYSGECGGAKIRNDNYIHNDITQFKSKNSDGLNLSKIQEGNFSISANALKNDCNGYSNKAKEALSYIHMSDDKKTTCFDSDPFQIVKSGNFDYFLSYIAHDKMLFQTQWNKKTSKTYDNENIHAYQSSSLGMKRDKNGATLLHWAAGCGHLKILKYIIEKLDVPPNQPQIGKRSFGGRTPLHWAARNGHLLIVQYLLDVSEVNLDATTIDGTTAFCWACWQGHLPIMKLLQVKGCDIHTVNSFGCNAVLWSAQSDSNDESTLSQSNALTNIKWLSSIGCNLGCINSNGHGILHKAAQRGKRDVCRWIYAILLETITSDDQIWYQKLIELRKYLDSDKGTLMALEWSKKIDILTLISPDVENHCPSDLAGMEGHISLAEWLSEKECDIALQIYRRYRNNEVTYMLSDLPLWIAGAVANAANLANRTNLDGLWEANAGVKKMALAIFYVFNK